MVEIHPKTRQRYTRDKRNTDIILPLQGPEALSTEKLTVIGGFKDFTGSGGRSTKAQMYGPLPDELWGTDAWIENARKKDLNVLGDRKQLIRLRQKREFIIFDE